MYENSYKKNDVFLSISTYEETHINIYDYFFIYKNEIRKNITKILKGIKSQNDFYEFHKTKYFLQNNFEKSFPQ